jgi:hypothetical protein
MEFIEKAKVRLDHWIHHSDYHNEEYESFAEELEEAGEDKSAGYIREMMNLNSKCLEFLRKALKALDKE